ncbi:putative Pol polyprotein [Cricetulus griseus]|nr:putative Pol polyprotein [Cricetulus griseus]
MVYYIDGISFYFIDFSPLFDYFLASTPHWTLKEMLHRQAGKSKPPKHRLHNALLTLNFLNANDSGQTAAERHWTTEKTAEVNQPVYFKDVLTSVWKPGHVLRWGRGFAFVSTGEENLWIPSKLIKIRVEEDNPLDNVDLQSKKSHLTWTRHNSLETFPVLAFFSTGPPHDYHRPISVGSNLEDAMPPFLIIVY